MTCLSSSDLYRGFCKGLSFAVVIYLPLFLKLVLNIKKRDVSSNKHPFWIVEDSFEGVFKTGGILFEGGASFHLQVLVFDLQISPVCLL